MADENGSATLTVPEMARRLGIGRNTGYEVVRAGLVPSLRLGKRIVVPRAALEKLLNGERGND